MAGDRGDKFGKYVRNQGLRGGWNGADEGAEPCGAVPSPDFATGLPRVVRLDERKVKGGSNAVRVTWLAYRVAARTAGLVSASGTPHPPFGPSRGNRAIGAISSPSKSPVNGGGGPD